ncbi:hypothetical protein EVAR_92070_1 [Eumeta japonica]|uniref:Uncharacterized protein n=1 Tax=Eumeta variegata TaxID=151549 RepID=A0A4C1SZ36_EUMVA|nr:hypothetical protein EVAR_92070_1 [Eumeta japonica]
MLIGRSLGWATVRTVSVAVFCSGHLFVVCCCLLCRNGTFEHDDRTTEETSGVSVHGLGLDQPNAKACLLTIVQIKGLDVKLYLHPDPVRIGD